MGGTAVGERRQVNHTTRPHFYQVGPRVISPSGPPPVRATNRALAIRPEPVAQRRAWCRHHDPGTPMFHRVAHRRSWIAPLRAGTRTSPHHSTFSRPPWERVRVPSRRTGMRVPCRIDRELRERCTRNSSARRTPAPTKLACHRGRALAGRPLIGSGCLESISVPTTAFGLGFATAASGPGSTTVLTFSVLLVPPEHYSGQEEQRKQHPKHWPDVHGNVHRSSLTVVDFQ